MTTTCWSFQTPGDIIVILANYRFVCKIPNMRACVAAQEERVIVDDQSIGLYNEAMRRSENGSSLKFFPRLTFSHLYCIFAP
jgi:hypothetical protein